MRERKLGRMFFWISLFEFTFASTNSQKCLIGINVLVVIIGQGQS